MLFIVPINNILAFDVDRCTHWYLIESNSDTMHPKVMIFARYLTFWKALVTSSKFSSVRGMAATDRVPANEQ